MGNKMREEELWHREPQGRRHGSMKDGDVFGKTESEHDCGSVWERASLPGPGVGR